MPADPLLSPLSPRHPLPLLEVAHVAHRLSASPEYVRRLIRGKELPVIRLGTRVRIDPVDLEAWIAARREASEVRP